MLRNPAVTIFRRLWNGGVRSAMAKRNHSVTVVGAAGDCGQAISMLMKRNNRITKLQLYDTISTVGMAVDLGAIPTKPDVKGFEGAEALQKALQSANIVIIADGVLCKSLELTNEELFVENAKIVEQVLNGIAQVAPEAVLIMVTSPVNTLIPYCAEILKLHNIYDPKRLFGISYENTMRARTFASGGGIRYPSKIITPVFGGQPNYTLVPLLSQSEQICPEDGDISNMIYKLLRYVGDLIVRAQTDAASANLSLAYGTDMLCRALLRALDTVAEPTGNAFVDAAITRLKVFSKKMDADVAGYLEMPEFNSIEEEYMKIALEQLHKEISESFPYIKNKK